MKKQYITPGLLVVKLTSEHALLEGSLLMSGNTVTDSNGGWTREYEVPISSNSGSSSVWDDEW